MTTTRRGARTRLRRKLAGALALGIALLAAGGLYTVFTPQQATAAIVVSYYWHFVDVVWIGLFTVIYFIR